MNRRNGMAFEPLALLIAFAAIAGGILIGTFDYARLEPSAVVTGITIGVAFALFAVAVTLLVRRIQNPVTRTVTIALAGMPRAGKTVFVNVLYQLLMEGRSPTGLVFTPEAKTARAVFQTVRRLEDGLWPPATTSDGIFRYRGEIEEVRSANRILNTLRGRTIYSLELGDSAGELWQQLGVDGRHLESDRNSPTPYLVDSTFFEYVASSTALFYFIDVSQFADNSESVRESVEDLLSSVQLIKASRRASGGDFPVTLILSKSDALLASETEAIYATFRYGSDFYVDDEVKRNLGPDFFESLRQVERAISVLSRISDNVGFSLVSAFDAAIEVGIIRADFESNFLRKRLPASGESESVISTILKVIRVARRR